LSYFALGVRFSNKQVLLKRQICWKIVKLFIDFEWDDDKAVNNQQKYGVSFEEALTVFDDPLYLEDYDEAHSEREDRFKIIGESAEGRLLIVIYVERTDRIRIISARLATNYERRYYELSNQQ
jgi:uncharacterized protein